MMYVCPVILVHVKKYAQQAAAFDAQFNFCNVQLLNDKLSCPCVV